jgi:hypothetical protein
MTPRLAAGAGEGGCCRAEYGTPDSLYYWIDHSDLRHRPILRVAGRERGAFGKCRCGNETIGQLQPAMFLSTLKNGRQLRQSPVRWE